MKPYLLHAVLPGHRLHTVVARAESKQLVVNTGAKLPADWLPYVLGPGRELVWVLPQAAALALSRYLADHPVRARAQRVKQAVRYDSATGAPLPDPCANLFQAQEGPIPALRGTFSRKEDTMHPAA